MEWPSLIVHRVVVHDVPSPNAGAQAPPPTLSERESPVDAQVTTHLREKIIGSVRSRNVVRAVPDPATTSPVPGLVGAYFASPQTQLVPGSQTMAQHLHNIQNAVNPPGLLAVVDCSLSGVGALAVLKLEQDVGARIQMQTVNGQHTFGMEVLHDLLLTQATRLFKIGVFVNVQNPNGTDGVYVFDGQTPYSDKSKVARFFLNHFLGCKLAEDPEVTTQKFFAASQEFFNNNVPDGTTRVHYTEHLLSEMTNQLSTVSPRQFAQRYLESGDRQAFASHLSDRGVPDSQFLKDLRFVRNRIAKLQVEFEHGLRIIGTRDVIDEHVEWTDMQNGVTKAEITGRLKDVRGA